MNAPMTITATRAVWLNQYHTPAELLSYIDKGDHGRACDILWCYGPTEKQEMGDGYTRIGECDITVRLLPRDKQTKMAVQALNKKLDELRAAYIAKQQEILDQINKLQAIEYVAEA